MVPIVLLYSRRVLFYWFCIGIFFLVVNGHVKRPQDEDIQSNVLEIIGSNIQSTYITCPADPAATLGIKLPFLVMIVKNLKKFFTFEIQVLDDKNVRRRFRASNFQVCKFAHVCLSYEFANTLQLFSSICILCMSACFPCKYVIVPEILIFWLVTHLHSSFIWSLYLTLRKSFEESQCRYPSLW